MIQRIVHRVPLAQPYQVSAMVMVLHPPVLPMEARPVDSPPKGENWLYEPKWDGFRCLAFRDQDEVYLQSKSGQPLARYFPDLVEAGARAAAQVVCARRRDLDSGQGPVFV